MDASSLLVNQITVGAIAAWLLQALKNSSWFPFLTQYSSRVTKVLASLLAAGVSITGLHYAYDPAAHTLLISGFGLALVANSVWHWVTQYIMQEGWYQLVFNKPTTVPVPTAGGEVAQAAVTASAVDIQKAQLKVEQKKP